MEKPTAKREQESVTKQKKKILVWNLEVNVYTKKKCSTDAPVTSKMMTMS
jgi:hypothetical protein